MTNTRNIAGMITIPGAQGTLTCPGRQRTNTGREVSPGTCQGGDSVNIRLGVFGIGDVAWASVNAEVYNLIYNV